MKKKLILHEEDLSFPFLIYNNMTPLYYAARLCPPHYKKRTIKRFVTLEEAINFIHKKTGLTIQNADIQRLYWDFGGGVTITGSEDGRSIAKRIRHKLTKPIITNFIKRKIVNLPDVPDDVLADILDTNDEFDRDNKILDYKLKHVDRYPELLS